MSIWETFLDGVDALSETAGNVAGAVVDWREKTGSAPTPSNPPSIYQGPAGQPDWNQPVITVTAPAIKTNTDDKYQTLLYASLALLAVGLFLKFTVE